MGAIEWSMWANEQAIASSGVLLLGGIIGVSGVFQNYGFAVYALIISIVIFLFEYPRGKRKKGNTIERRFQHVLVPAMAALGPVTRNYYVRFAVYLVLCIPCYFILPTLLGGICLLITSIVYFVAALKGEQWMPVPQNKQDPLQRKPLTTSEAPTRPPPRPPLNRQSDSRI